MMRKILSLLFIFSSFALLAQEETKDTTYWSKGGTYGINFTQVSLTNWAAGGQNSVSGVTQLKLFANYKKKNLAWENKLDMGYGLSKMREYELQKIEDLIDLQSKFGLQTSNKWYFTVLGGFKTQFTPGYSDKENTVKASNLFAPAYISIASGMDYKPSKEFSLFLSPVTGKVTIVTDKDLDGKFGVESGKTARMEFGASLRTAFKKEILKNVNFDTDLGLFTNYLNNPEKIDVDWKAGIIMSVNKFLSVRINTHLIYDYDIKLPVKDKPGETKDQIQFKELLGVGFNFKF
jgi:hypothetical protein